MLTHDHLIPDLSRWKNNRDKEEGTSDSEKEIYNISVGDCWNVGSTSWL